MIAYAIGDARLDWQKEFSNQQKEKQESKFYIEEIRTICNDESRGYFNDEYFLDIDEVLHKAENNSLMGRLRRIQETVIENEKAYIQITSLIEDLNKTKLF